MPGPIDSLRFVHSAILNEAIDLEKRGHANPSAEDAAKIREDLRFLNDLLHAHTHGEEAGLFPPLDEKLPHYSDAYLFDHEEERALFQRVDEHLGQAAEGDAEAMKIAARELIEVRCMASAHVTKENGLVFPLVCELFSVEEQGAMVQKILGAIDPAAMPKLVPWIINRVSADEAEGYVNVLSRAMPPPVFEKAKGWIAEGVRPERYADLKSRVDALA